MNAGSPTPRGLCDLRKRAIYFRIELESCIGTALPVPIERCIVFSRRGVVKFDGKISGHREASLNYVCALPPMEWFLCGRNPAPQFASRFQRPKQPGLPRRPCHQGSKSRNPPTPPVPRPTVTTPALAAWKLPMSFVPYRPHLQPILSPRGILLQRQNLC